MNNLFKKQKIRLKAIWSQPDKGFGDTFSKLTMTFGIKPCNKCLERKKSWNERVKYQKEGR
tara:strand:+ start:3584 stop:3766 length:183 start_codon:yes stop_codon:yes gene_type:complete